MGAAVAARTHRAFLAGEMRDALDVGAVPDFGRDAAGLLGIACGAIDVGGASESFRGFRDRCVALVETLGKKRVDKLLIGTENEKVCCPPCQIYIPAYRLCFLARRCT